MLSCDMAREIVLLQTTIKSSVLRFREESELRSNSLEQPETAVSFVLVLLSFTALLVLSEMLGSDKAKVIASDRLKADCDCEADEEDASRYCSQLGYFLRWSKCSLCRHKPYGKVC